MAVGITNLDDNSDTDTLIDDIDESTEVQGTKDSLKSRTIALDYQSLVADLTHALIDAKDEEALIELFSRGQGRDNLEILFLPLQTDEEVEVYTACEEGSVQVPLRAMNVVQVAAA